MHLTTGVVDLINLTTLTQELEIWGTDENGKLIRTINLAFRWKRGNQTQNLLGVNDMLYLSSYMNYYRFFENSLKTVRAFFLQHFYYIIGISFF